MEMNPPPRLAPPLTPPPADFTAAGFLTVQMNSFILIQLIIIHLKTGGYRQGV